MGNIGECSINIKPEKLILTTVSAGTDAYFKHYADAENGKKFTDVDRINILVDLLNRVAEKQRGGEMVSDVKIALSKKISPFDNAFIDLTNNFIHSINKAKEYDTIEGKDKIDPDNFIFRVPEGPERKAIYQSYIDKYSIKEPGNPKVEDYTLEMDKDNSSKHKVKDIETKNTTIRRLLKTMDTRHVSPMIDYFKNVISTNHVDTRVINGDVKGFTSLKDVIANTQNSLKERVYDYFATKSIGTFDEQVDGLKTRYIVYTEDSKPIGIDKGALNQISDQAYYAKQKELYKVFGDSVKVVVAPTVDIAIEAITSGRTTTPKFEYINKINYSGDNTYQRISMGDNPDNMDSTELPAYFAYKLLDPAVFGMFVKSEYPSLDKAYNERFRADHAEPGTVSGPDQDSAATKLHKQSTPKLIVTPNGISIDVDQPYLTTDDFNSVASELSSLGTTAKDMEEGILKLAESSETLTNKKSIFYSIYHRFFNPEKYTINHTNADHSNLNPEGPVEYKSYVAIANTHVFKELGLAEYENTSTESHKNANQALQDSLSEMITSMRSIVVSDKISMLNRFLKKTNIRGNGLNLEEFNRQFVKRTTTPSGTETQPALLNNEIIITRGDGSIDTKPRLNIRVYTTKKVEGSDLERSYIDYTVGVNISTTGADGKLVFTNGKPIEIINTSKSPSVTSEDVAKVFSKFKLPIEVTSNRKRGVQKLKEALINDNSKQAIYKDIKDSANKDKVDVTLDTFYLNSIFPLILNGGKKVDSSQAIRKLIPMLPEVESTTATPYTFKGSINGYNKVVTDVMARITTESGKSKSISLSGNQLSSHGLKSNIESTKELSEKLRDNDILRGNLLTEVGGEFSTTGKSYTKDELQQYDTIKNLQQFTEKENAIFLIEGAMLQPAYASADKSTAMFQIGTQSDRLHPKVNEFTVKGGIFMPGIRWSNSTNMNRWSTSIGPKIAEIIKTDSGKVVDQTYIDSIGSISLLKKFFEANKIPYNQELKDTGILNLVRIYKDSNGKAVVSPIAEEDSNGPDFNKFARKALYVHQNYYGNIDTTSTKVWNETLGENFKNIFEVANHLNKSNIDYNELRTHADLVSNMMIAPKKVMIDGKVKTIAVVPEETLQDITMFSDDMLGLEYMEHMRNMFLKQMDEIGYNAISPSSVKYIGDMLGSKKLDHSVAKDILFNTYFYLDHILGQSALNLHSHGGTQYDSKPKSRPLLDTRTIFENGNLDYQKTIKQAQDLQVPILNKSLKDITVPELLDLREKALRPGYEKKHAFTIERLAFMKTILENESSFPTEESKAKALLFNDVTRHLNDKFVSQVKRNQVYGSGVQLLRLAGKNEPGWFIPEEVHEIVVKDDKVKSPVLGVSGEAEMEATDGVQEMTELFKLAYNNSLGNNESSFRNDGAANKDLTIDNYGHSTRIGKKATFPTMSNDMLRRSSVLADQKLEKLFSAIEFSSPTMMIDVPGPKTWAPVSEFNWKQHGLSLGYLKYTDVNGNVIVRHASKILDLIKNSEIEKQKFSNELKNNQYETDKKSKVFKHVHEMWEYFGAHTNPDAYQQIADIIGYHSGIETKNIDLSDAVYPNRNAYVAKIGYASQEKSGTTKILPYEALTNPDYDISNSIVKVNHSFYGPMLQAEHGFDTTSKSEGLTTADIGDTHASRVSVMTQALASVIAEGVSKDEAIKINQALADISEANVTGALKKIIRTTLNKYPKLKETENIENTLLEELRTGKQLEHKAQLSDGIKEYSRELIAESLSKTSNDPGLAAELLAASLFDSLTFDQKQLFPLFHSTLFSEFNKKGVRIKFNGGQYIVSPAHRFLSTYSLFHNNQRLRGGLTREDMNKYFHGDNYKNLAPGIIKDAIDQSYPLAKITDLNKVKLSDIITHDGIEEEFIHIKNRIREEYNNSPEPKPSFKSYLTYKINEGDYNFRFGKISASDKLNEGDNTTEESLKYASWHRWTNDGKEINALDTDEYKSFKAIDLIRDSFESIPYNEFFNLDLTKKKDEIFNDINKNIPKGLLRDYYFSNSSIKKQLPVEHTITFLSKAQNSEFTGWLIKNKTKLISTDKGPGIIESMYKYIGDNAIRNPNFKDRFKTNLYNLLQDETKGWVPEHTEVLMPHMHGSFYVDPAKGNTPGTSLIDIAGLRGIPSTSKFESMGILTREQANRLSFNFDKHFQNTLNELNANKNIPQEHLDMFDKEYITPMRIYRENAKSYFSDRIRSLYPTKQSNYNIKKGAVRSNLFLYKSFILEDVLAETKKKIQSLDSLTGSHYEALKSIQQKTEAAILAKDGKFTGKDIVSLVRSKFIKSKTMTTVDNFPKTLEFIMARIPGPAKQTFTAGKIKSFISSSKNSIYSPTESLLLSGQDFDIDKQNIMTWAFDADNKLYDWKDFEDKGVSEFSLKTLNTKIKESIANVDKEFTNTLINLRSEIKKLTKDAEDSEYAGGTVHQDINTKLTNTKVELTTLENKIEEIKENEEKRLITDFSRAGQNLILHNMSEVILSPKNAIESSTPTTVEKPASSTKIPEISKLFTDKIDLADLFFAQKITSRLNPLSTIQYERENMVGKSGIGITASDTKGYYAAYTATLNATESELPHVQLKTDLSDLEPYFDDAYKINRGALQFFKQKPATSTEVWNSSNTYKSGEVIKNKTKNGEFNYTAISNVPKGIDIKDKTYWKLEPEVLTFNYISNAEKWSDRGRSLSTVAAKARKELTDVDEKDINRQVEIINKYIDEVKAFDKFNIDSQAWNDLSQLLNAATDNAKELILGRIGVNNTTNSIVATMIRLGVPMEDALNLINDPSVSPLIKQVELESDTQTNAELRREREAKGIVEEDTYADKLIEKLRAIKNDLAKPASVGTDPEKVVSYLTSPIRQLFTYANASSEFALSSKLLSLNQGLRVTAFDADSYIRSINKSMKRLAVEYNKSHTDNPIDFKFDLNDFITNIGTNPDALNKLFEDVNKIRTAINVPFILTKNTHFISYFKALAQVQKLSDFITYTNRATNDVIDHSGTEKTITSQIQGKVTDTIYDRGILRYFKDKTKPFELRGQKYDLSEPQATKHSLGRLEFLRDMPDIIKNIEDNYFIESLKFDSSILDPNTNTSITVLKGKDLRLVKDTRVLTDLQNGLSKLEKDDKELYDALFYYSIVTTKGSYAGGSYTSLFTPEKYVDFGDFLQKNATDLEIEIDNNKDYIVRQNPLLLQQFSTLAKNYKEPTIGGEESAIEPEDINIDIQDDPEFFNANRGNARVGKEELTKKKFIIDHLNASRLKENSIMPDWWRSHSNGFTYRWNNELGMYIPLTSDIPEIAIRSRIPDESQNIKLSDYGYLEGFRVNLPEYTDGGSRFIKGYVLGHVTDAMLARKEGKLKDILTASAYTSGKTKLSGNERNLYIVRDERGDYSVHSGSKDDLGYVNPGAIFDEGYVQPIPDVYSIDSVDVDPETYVFKRQGEYYRTRGEADKRNIDPGEKSEAIPIKLGKRASQGMKTVYDENTVEKLLSFIKNVSDSYSEDRLNEQFNAYRNNLIYNITASRFDDVTPSMVKDAIEFKTDPNILNATDSVSDAVDREIGDMDTPSILKLDILSKGKFGIESTFTKLKSTRPIRFTYLDSIGKHGDNFVIQPETNKIVKDFLTNDPENNITKLSVSQFKKLVDLVPESESVFNSYIENSFLKKLDMDCTIIDDKVYMTKAAKIKATKQLEVAENALSRPIRVPQGILYEYKSIANKDIFMALSRHLNSVLPGTTWKVLSEKQIEETYGEDYNEKGFFKAKGEIVINSDKATLETPFHEFGHLYLQHLKTESVDEYSRIMELCQDHGLFTSMQKTYRYSSNPEVAEEVFCELLSMQAADKLVDSKDPALSEITDILSNGNSIFGKVKKFFSDLFSKFFGTKVDLKMSDSLKSVIDSLSSDVLFNKDSILNSFSEETKNSILKLKTGAELTLKEAKDILLSRGYIEWFCVN